MQSFPLGQQDEKGDYISFLSHEITLAGIPSLLGAWGSTFQYLSTHKDGLGCSRLVRKSLCTPIQQSDVDKPLLVAFNM